MIADCLSPYFASYNVNEFFDDSTGGKFGERISSNLRERRTREVIILFGGKGSGKSTFIRRLLYHRPPEPIKHFAVVAVVDLLECPEDRNHIENALWSKLLERLDQDKVLRGDRNGLLALFEDRFEVAKRQMLYGLKQDSDNYNLEVNRLIERWLGDREYCAVLACSRIWRSCAGAVFALLNRVADIWPAE